MHVCLSEDVEEASRRSNPACQWENLSQQLPSLSLLKFSSKVPLLKLSPLLRPSYSPQMNCLVPVQVFALYNLDLLASFQFPEVKKHCISSVLIYSFLHF
jgi:hypothetical protein